jgi:MFS family permease
LSRESDQPKRRPFTGGLWGNQDFLKLWAGQTISVFGSLITRIALPFTAVLYLKATPTQMALLAAADLLPGFLVGLFAGALVDRLRRRPLLIATDIARALLLVTISVAAIFQVLGIAHLFIVAVLGGALTTLFDIAYGAYLPSLVETDELMEGNSRLAASVSLASVGSFAIAGWLVQAFSGPQALLIDALSFLFSAVMLLAIRRPERKTEPVGADEPDLVHLLTEVREGLHVVWSHPLLRPLAISGGLLDFGMMLFGSMVILFTTRTLGFSPGVQGSIFAIGGVTAMAGAALAGRITRRFGAGPSMIGGLVLTAVGSLFVPLAPGRGFVGGACLAANQVVTDPAYTVFEIKRTSLRQAAVEDRLRGRVNGTFRVCSLGAMLAGTVVAGVLAERIGLRATVALGAAAGLPAALVLALSPLRRLRSIEEVAVPDAAAQPTGETGQAAVVEATTAARPVPVQPAS